MLLLNFEAVFTLAIALLLGDRFPSPPVTLGLLATGALLALAVLREPITLPLLLAAGLMAAGVVLLLHEKHSHRHRHQVLLHAHRHRHDPRVGDPHHDHPHASDQLPGHPDDQPFWHAHEHLHGELEHAHPHVSDAHHRHRH